MIGPSVQIQSSFTARGEVLESPSGKLVPSTSVLGDTFKDFEEVPVTMWSPEGTQSVTFTVKRDELQNFVVLLSDIYLDQSSSFNSE